MFVVFAVAFCCCITLSNVECLCYLFVLVCMEFHHSMRQNGRCLCTHPVAVPSVGPNALHVFKSNVVKSVEGADFVVIRVDYGLYI